MRPFVLPVLAAILLGIQGCATKHFDTAKYNTRTPPAEVARNPAQYTDTSFLWGGVIVNSANIENGTQIEVLAYPLGSSQRPDPDRAPDGRFLIIDKRYLETLDYAPGRLLTVAGSFTGTRDGQIGATSYVYPVVQPEQLQLWPKDSTRSEPQFHIGIGAVFGH